MLVKYGLAEGQNKHPYMYMYMYVVSVPYTDIHVHVHCTCIICYHTLNFVCKINVHAWIILVSRATPFPQVNTHAQKVGGRKGSIPPPPSYSCHT